MYVYMECLSDSKTQSYACVSAISVVACVCMCRVCLRVWRWVSPCVLACMALCQAGKLKETDLDQSLVRLWTGTVCRSFE